MFKPYGYYPLLVIKYHTINIYLLPCICMLTIRGLHSRLTATMHITNYCNAYKRLPRMLTMNNKSCINHHCLGYNVPTNQHSRLQCSFQDNKVPRKVCRKFIRLHLSSRNNHYGGNVCFGKKCDGNIRTIELRKVGCLWVARVIILMYDHITASLWGTCRMHYEVVIKF